MPVYATTIGTPAFELHSSSAQCKLLYPQATHTTTIDGYLWLFSFARGLGNCSNQKLGYTKFSRFRSASSTVTFNDIRPRDLKFIDVDGTICGFTLNEIRLSRVTRGFRAAFDGGTFSTNSR